MKKNLTKLLFIFLFIPLSLLATSYEWDVEISKNVVHQNEAIYLKYTCRFSDEAEFHAVEFAPMREDEKLSIEVLSEQSLLVDGKKVLSYEFVIFPHHAGELDLAFEAVMKKTTKDSIENTVIGRDNGKYAEYENTTVALPVQKVTVLPLNADLVGDISLEIIKDEPQIKAFLPYHLELRLSGVGNLDRVAAFDFEARGVKIFAEEPKREFQLTRKGYEGVWSQKFAFVSERDFTIAHKPLEVFNPTMQKSKSLRFESIDVKVEAGYKKEELLDEVKAQESYFKRDYLYCFLAFVAGFLVSKLRLRLRFGEKKSPFCQKVQNAASLEALSVLLILSDTQKYDSIVQKIETKELTSLRKAKRLICG